VDFETPAALATSWMVALRRGTEVALAMAQGFPDV